MGPILKGDYYYLLRFKEHKNMKSIAKYKTFEKISVKLTDK